MKKLKAYFLTPAPMISFCSSQKLSIYLDRAKLQPLEGTLGSVQCKGKQCQTCHNVKERETFTITTTGKTFKINQKLNCNDEYLVYIFAFKVSVKQYVGQMGQEFRFRWNNYKDIDYYYQEYGTCMQQHLFQYFSEEGHLSFRKDDPITLIRKTDPSNRFHRENYWRSRERNYWRSTLKTMTPWD